MDCVFCKIVAGEIPCKKLYEDDHVIAFLDVNPLSDGHTLVIPKEHYEFLHDCPAEVVSKVGQVLPRIVSAIRQGMSCDDYNVLCNNGESAGQVVKHVHFHVIPRMEKDGVFTQWPAYQYEKDEADQVYEKIMRKM